MNNSKEKNAASLKRKLRSSRSSGNAWSFFNNSFNQFQDSLTIALKAYQNDIKKNKSLALIDTVSCGMIYLGIAQFASVVILKDTFPFNAFLAGFISCVGQFVLLISLRLQVVEQFEGISKHRAFGEFVFASLVLHFICLHFIN